MKSMDVHQQFFALAEQQVAKAAPHSTDRDRSLRILDAVLDRMCELEHSLHDCTPESMAFLARRLCQSYERTGDKLRLDDAIRIQEQAVAVAQDEDNLLAMQSLLWTILDKRLTRNGPMDDLNRAINLGNEILQADLEERHQSAYLNDVACKYGHRFECTRSIKDIDRAVKLYEDALEMTTDSIRRAMILDNLGKSLSSRFEYTGAMKDINRAIELAMMALEAHSNRISVLNTLGLAYCQRYEVNGSIADFNQAKGYIKEALTSLPLDHSDYYVYLDNFRSCLTVRSKHTGLLEDLSSAIEVANEVLEASPEATSLAALGKSLLNRCERFGSSDDLDRSIELTSEALDITPLDHFERIDRLYELGRGLSIRFNRTGSKRDLERSISLLEEAKRVIPWNHRDRAPILAELGDGFLNLFKQNGFAENLHQAIQLISQALACTPTDSPKKDLMLSWFATVLVDRSKFTGAEEDLEYAVQIARKAEKTPPLWKPDQLRHLHDIASIFQYHFERNGSIESNDRAIDTLEQVLKLCPPDYPDRDLYLDDLGNALAKRFVRYGSEKDINAAVKFTMAAVEATALDHRKAQWLSSLSEKLIRKYRYTRTRYWEANSGLEDLDRAIDAAIEALRITSQPIRIKALVMLGHALLDKHEESTSLEDFEPFLSAFKEDWILEVTPAILKIDVIKLAAIMFALNRDWEISTKLMEEAVELLPTSISKSQRQADKQYMLLSYTGLAPMTAASALNARREPCQVLRILELGRSLIAGFLMGLRADISLLKQHHPKLAAEFVALRDELDVPADQAVLWKSGSEFSRESKVEQYYESDRRLGDVIKRIRAQPEFSGFLLAPTADELMAAAKPGPIVVVNVAPFRCDAILIEHHQIRALYLPRLSMTEVEDRSENLRISGPALSPQITSILEWLWDAVAGPCLDALGFRNPVLDDNWPHVWWIPTGKLSFLPLHAAGRHMKGSKETVLDKVISSYSLSIKALIYGRGQISQKAEPEARQNALLISMPETPNKTNLPFAADELTVLENMCPSLQLNAIRLQQRTRGEVLKHLKTCKIFHFAGHGHADSFEPSNSCLLLEDWQMNPLTMGRLRDLRLQENAPFLGYLSACSTGANEADKLHDEGINLVSACQLAGFRHVVGTLWEVFDEHCVAIAKTVYKTLRDEGMNDIAVARGLHLALRALRDESIKTGLERDCIECDEDVDARAEREGRDGTLKTLKKSVKGIANSFWVPYVHYGI
ncbi:MAG: hypothetical protein Q9217_006321 [Psora testacea]